MRIRFKCLHSRAPKYHLLLKLSCVFKLYLVVIKSHTSWRYFPFVHSFHYHEDISCRGAEVCWDPCTMLSSLVNYKVFFFLLQKCNLINNASLAREMVCCIWMILSISDIEFSPHVLPCLACCCEFLPLPKMGSSWA